MGGNGGDYKRGRKNYKASGAKDEEMEKGLICLFLDYLPVSQNSLS